MNKNNFFKQTETPKSKNIDKSQNSQLKYYYGRQCISGDDIQAVTEVLKSDLITQGPKAKEFENELSKFFGAKFAATVANGTAGLHLIGLALGWKQDDIIITSPITFLASANCAIYAGAKVDFVDIDEKTYTIDPNKLEDKIKSYSSKNKKIKAVVAVDYAGHPCDWKSLNELKNKYDFQLINDFCHALGAEYENDIKYAVKYADAVNLSFHPVKHITTGEGGAVLTNNELIDRKIKTLRTHGMTKDEAILEKNDGPWYYEMHEVGFNYRITDFQCALGISQLKKLNKFLEQRRTIANFYNNYFKDDERFITPFVASNVKHAYHLYPLQIKFDELKIDKKEFYFRLKENGVVFQVHYIPVHLQPFYKKNFGFKEGDFPISEKFYQRELSIPIYPSLNEEDLTFISNAIVTTLNEMK